MLLLGNKTYDFFKRLVQVILPAVGALYFGLANVWGLPNAEQVVGTIAIVTTFLGVVLGISNAQYQKSDASFDGLMVVGPPVEPGEPKTVSLELNSDFPLADIETKKSLTFKVKPENTP
jgi:hypothetical protein